MTELEVGVSAAKTAGEYILSFFGSSQNVRFKFDNSPVTDVDIGSSEIVKKIISNAFPNHSILCEEAPDALARRIGPEPTWVIDPLDGTSNFIAHIPLFAVVIAYVVGGKTQAGVIFDPLHNDLFVAQAGKGTTLNGQPVRVSTKSNVRGAMLFAGRGYRDRDHERHGHIIYALEQHTTYFRRLGAASIMLSSVACGRADSVILTGNIPWDVAAGALLIQEAGGLVTDYCGKPWTLDSEDLVASNGLIHEELIRITRKQEASPCL